MEEQETILQDEFGNKFKEIELQCNNNNNNYKQQKQQLPNQILSESDDLEIDDKHEEEKNSSDEDDFDLQKFRKSNQFNRNNQTRSTHNLISKSRKYTQQQSIKINDQQQIQHFENQQQYYYYLGMKFELSPLLERNRNPALLLNLILFLVFTTFLLSTIVTLTAIKNALIGCILQLIFSITSLITIFTFLNISLSTKKFSKIDLLKFSLGMLSGTMQVLYYLIFDTPFQQIVYFLVFLQFIGFSYFFILAIVLLPNNTQIDDINYQQKFFFSRILMAILNSTGVIDVLSDIALGVELIKLQGILKILGIFLFLLCILDFLIVQIRVISPKKVTISMHVGAVFLETGILTISIVALFLAQKQSQNENKNEFKLLLYLSLVTTSINFLHHIFVISEQRISIQSIKTGFNTSVLFN